MIKIERDWATPLMLGVFGLMAVTGILMFFHANSHLQEEVHQWAGWVVVVAAVGHVAANWLGFRRYFTGWKPKVALLVGASALVLAGSFVSLGGGEEAASPPAIAIGALTQAPIAQVAPLFGRTGAQAVQALQAAGVAVQGEADTLQAATGGDRGQVGKALSVLAAKPAGGA